MALNVIRPTGLSELELASLGVWFVGAGTWHRMNFSEPEAREFAVHFFKCLNKDDPESSLRASYLSLQNTFMAMRRGTFEAIQSEPPFSRFGRRCLKALLRAWLHGGETEFRSRWSKIFIPGWQVQVQQERPLSVVADSGESAAHAIHIVEGDLEDRVNGEYWYLYYEYGQGWRCQQQMSTGPDTSGRRYDILNILFRDGQERQFYFLLGQ